MKKILVILMMLVLTGSNLFAQQNLKDVEPRNHKITFGEADEYASRYEAIKEITESSPVEFNFDLEQVREFINEVNGKWFSIKKGLDKQGNENVVLSIYSSKMIRVGSYALEVSYPCPPWCN